MNKKRVLGWTVAVIGIIAVSINAYQKYRAKMLESERELNWARIEREYLERVGWIRRRFHQTSHFDDYLVELQKKTDKEQVAEKKASYAYVRGVFDSMRDGKYEPLFSASDKGMRLDVVSASVKNVMGKPQIQLAIVLWGAQRELRDESIASGSVVVTNRRRMYTSAQFNVNWKLLDEQGTFLGEVKLDGDPTMKVEYPERFIAEFPPQMVLGYFPNDLLPNEIEQSHKPIPVSKLEIAFTVASRAPSGGDAVANFVWKLNAPQEWKLGPGEKWVGAEESVRPIEEIDPKKASKAQAQN
jgi:hypothetical protein